MLICLSLSRVGTAAGQVSLMFGDRGSRRMNPSYCRVRVPQAAALERFAAWQHLPLVGPLVPADSVQAVGLACDDRGEWRGHAVLVSEVGGWTLFADLSGVLGGVPAERWREFAGS